MLYHGPPTIDCRQPLKLVILSPGFGAKDLPRWWAHECSRQGTFAMNSMLVLVLVYPIACLIYVAT